LKESKTRSEKLRLAGLMLLLAFLLYQLTMAVLVIFKPYLFEFGFNQGSWRYTTPVHFLVVGIIQLCITIGLLKSVILRRYKTMIIWVVMLLAFFTFDLFFGWDALFSSN